MELKLIDWRLPGSGLPVNNLAQPVTLKFKPTSSQGSTFECKYYNTTSGQWTSEGVETATGTAGEVVCKTTHLSGYTVFASKCWSFCMFIRFYVFVIF
jgi:hypothetical protein